MDALWDDSNILPRSPRPERPPLFLASPSASPEKTRPSNASKTANPDFNELDLLFADIDNLEAPRSRQGKRTAESGGSKKPTSRPSVVNVLLSDEDDDETPTNRSNDAKGGGEEEDGKKKARKKPVKLDENRLLGRTGFPALIEQHRRFKPSGKGNEAKDLKRLLQMYQFWAVKMYPRSDFRETTDKVEKLCHSRRMQNALNSFRGDLESAMKGPQHEIIEEDAAQGGSGSDDNDEENNLHATKPLPAPVFDSVVGIEEDENAEENLYVASSRASTSMSLTATTSELDDLIAADLVERRAALERDRALRQNTTASSSSMATTAIESNSAGSKTTKVAASETMEDDWDLDALLAEENEVRAHFNETVINVTTTLGRTAGPSEPDFDVDVDLDVDVAMDPKPTQSHLPEPGRGRNVAVAGNPEPKHPPDKADPFDEDEDMWDMINQVHG